MQRGDFAEAGAQLRESLRLRPDMPEAHYLLAVALACQGSFDSALLHYDHALALRPETDVSSTLHELLADHYAKGGRFQDAIQSAQRALRLAQSAGSQTAVDRIRERLTRYEQGEQTAPFRSGARKSAEEGDR
jgi:Flp pilus assembly protein TadD